MSDKWAAAFNNGDAAAVAAMYAEDAYVLPPGAANGQRAQRDRGLLGQSDAAGRRRQARTVDVQRLGRRSAREIGTVTLETKAQPPQQIAGKYVVVWRRIGGQWLLATDIWNADK